MRERKLEVDFEKRLAAEAVPRRRLVPLLAALAVLCTLAVVSTFAMRIKQSEPFGAVASLQGEMETVRQAVDGLYAGQTDHQGLDDGILASSGRLPQGMVFGKILRHSLGGSILVSAADDGWSLQADGLPDWACIDLARSGSEGATRIRVVSGGITATADAAAMDDPSAVRACGGYGPRSVTWTFR